MAEQPPPALPRSYASLGDPIPRNPFPEGDPRHAVWKKATRSAEGKLAHLDAQLLEVPADGLDFPVNAPLLVKVPAAFDIWAERLCAVVWNDDDVARYSEWLVDYADHWIETVSGSEVLDSPTGGFLSLLRNRLAARVRPWQAEVRRFRSVQTSMIDGSTIPIADSHFANATKNQGNATD